MKKYIFGAIAIAATLSMSSCEDFLEVKPSGIVDDETAFDEPEKMVTAAYASLGADWYSYPFNLWPYGSLASDDALKGGSGLGDTGYHPFEIWSALTNDRGELDELWYRLYCGISRCNRALIALNNKGTDKLGESLAKQREGEVRFLRAHFYFKLIQVWYRVPWVDEAVLEANAQEQTPNNLSYEELMAKVIEDFTVAFNNVEENPKDKARVSKAAAAAMLAKCYLTKAYGDGYEKNTGYSHVNKDDIQKVIDYTDPKYFGRFGYEEDFGDIFMEGNENGKESIFAVQHSGHEADGTKFGRGNWSNMLNGCWGIWSCGWDFHKPSQNLVNAFKVDENGLPMFDDYEKEHNVYPVNGITQDQKWDPRLFHTVGIPSFPYKYETELVMTYENSRNPNDYGFYTSLKEIPQRSKGEEYDSPWQCFGMNDYVVRYTEMMLWRAEALIERNDGNDIENAIKIINTIRDRANKSVNKYIGYAKNQIRTLGKYSETGVSQNDARKYLRWEKRLEMAMESERFFDLRRWGMASETINNYFNSDKDSKYNYTNKDGEKVEIVYAGYLKDGFFESGKNEYWPIAFNQLFYVPGLYEQNKGYK